MRKVVGISKFTSKKGMSCAVIHCLSDFTNDDIQKGASGQKVEPIMVYGNDVDSVSDKFIGKELQGFFGYSGGSIVCQGPCVK